MTSTETTAKNSGAADVPFVPEDVLREAVSTVLAVRMPGEEAEEGGNEGESAVPAFVVSGPESTRMEGLGVDSLLIAEIIVELEQRLDTLLELHSGTRLETFADLHAALRPVSST